MSSKRRLTTNAIANYMGQITTLGIGILLTPFIIAHLGNALYGVWALVVALQGLGGLLDFGVTTSIVKFVAQHYAREEHDEISKVTSSSFFLHLVMGTTIFAVMAGLAYFGMPLLHLNAEEVAVARQSLLIAGATLMFSLPLSVLGNLLLGLQRYEVSNIISIVYTIGSAIAIVIALPMGAGPVGLISINGLGLILMQGARAIYAARLMPKVQLSWRLAQRETLGRIGGYSAWLFVLDVAKKLFYNADAVTIAAFLPVSSITAYNLGFKPASAVSYFAGPFAQVFLPAASDLDARNEKAGLERLLTNGTRLATLLTLPSVLWLWVFGKQVLEVWLGPGHEDALPVMYFFLGTFLVSASQNPATMILKGIGRVRVIAVYVLVEYTFNIILSILLIPRIGVVGAAVGTFIPALINNLIFIPRLTCKALGLDYKLFIKRGLTGPALAAVPSLAVLWALGTVLTSATLITVILSAAASVLVTAVFYWLLATDRDERTLLSGKAGQFFGSVRNRVLKKA